MKTVYTCAILSVVSTVSLSADFETFISSNTPPIPVDQRGFDRDPDKDGIPSGIEYVAREMNPGVSDAHLMPTPQLDGTDFVYTFEIRAGVDLTPVIEEWNAGSWEPASSGVTLSGNSLTLRVPMTSTDHLLARVSVSDGSGDAIPTDNPVAARYPTEYASGEYAWTDAIAWDRVFCVNDAPYNAVADGDFATSTGTDNWAAINAAILDAAAAGGGVVYFKEGTYYCGDHLFLPPGVVLRGANLVDGMDSGVDRNLDPPTDLVFPKYTFNKNDDNGNGTPTKPYFKRIFSDAVTQLDDQDTDPVDFASHGNIGIVNMDLNRTSVMFDIPDANPIKTGAFSRDPNVYLAPFAVENGIGKNFIILSVRSNNPGLPRGADSQNLTEQRKPNDQTPWQRHPRQTHANFRIMSGGNALVANCRLNDLSSQNIFVWGWPDRDEGQPFYFDDSFEQIGYIAKGLVPLNRVGQATFRHSNQYGVSINGLYFFARAAKAGYPADPWGNSQGWFGSPNSAPWLFLDGHVIRDTYIFSTAGAKVEASGNGLKILNNFLEDKEDKLAWYRSDGWTLSTGSTVRGRGLLIGGSDVLVEDNFVHTTVWKNGLADGVGVAGSPTNDSEAILFDNTTSIVDGYTVRNNQVSGPLSVWKIRGGCRDLTITGNDFTTNGPSTNNNANLPIIIEEGQVQNVLIADNTNVKRTLSLSIKSTATPDRSTTIIQGNSAASGFSPQLKADFSKVTVPPRSNPGFDVVDTPTP